MKRARCKPMWAELRVGTRRRDTGELLHAAIAVLSVSTAGEARVARPIPAFRGTHRRGEWALGSEGKRMAGAGVPMPSVAGPPISQRCKSSELSRRR